MNAIQPDLDQIHAAQDRIAPYAHRTPVVTSQTLDKMSGAALFFKCENVQKGGAFKFRGAANTVLSLSEEKAKRGVATHSSGNHAGALALAASMRGIPAHIVMPSNAPQVKVAAVRNYGGQITFCQPSLASREETADRVIAKTGATLVHPYNDVRIIAGQGTAVLELLEDAGDLDAVLTPVGGGGLLSGTAIAAKSVNPSIRVVGCEPEQADDAFRSKQAGRIIPVQNPDTIADGLRTSLGEFTFPVIRDVVDEIVLVSEEAIVQAMRLAFERMKLVIETSSAVPLAAVLSGKLNVKGKRVGIILSGGNVDLSVFWAMLEGRASVAAAS